MLEHLITRFGYLAVGLGTFLEGETILLVAGAMAHRGLLALPWVILSAFVGSLIGDQLWFWLGHKFGRSFIAQRPHLKSQVARADRLLRRYGRPFVLGFRFLYGLRTVTPVLLGASGYPPGLFALLNALGAALWAVSFGALGYAVGASVSSLLGRATHLEEALVVSLVLVAALWALTRRKRSSNADEGPPG